MEIASQTAVWYHSGKPPVPLRWVLIRDPEGAFDPQALLCTALDVTPEQILAWFVQRWQLEVTLEECRAHLGMETQRQWNDQAIARTTPALLGLFSLVTLLAHRLLGEAACPDAHRRLVHQAAAHLQRYPGAGAPLSVDAHRFSAVPGDRGHPASPQGLGGPSRGPLVLRGVTWTKSS